MIRGNWKSWVRGSTPINYRSTYGEPQINNRGDVSITQGLPPATEGCRLGDYWLAQSVSGVAVTAINALPLSALAPTFLLLNGEPFGNGKSYIIDFAGVSISNSVSATLLSIICGVGEKLPVNMTLLNGPAIPKSLSGKANYTGKAQFISAQAYSQGSSSSQVLRPAGGRLNDYTHQIPNNGFDPTQQLVRATSHKGQPYFSGQGIYVVPPGGMFWIHAMTPEGTQAFNSSIIWQEAYIRMNENS